MCEKLGWAKSHGSWIPRGGVRTLVKDFTQGVGRLSTVFWKDHRAQTWLGWSRQGCVPRDWQEALSLESRKRSVGTAGTSRDGGGGPQESLAVVGQISV